MIIDVCWTTTIIVHIPVFEYPYCLAKEYVGIGAVVMSTNNIVQRIRVFVVEVEFMPRSSLNLSSSCIGMVSIPSSGFWSSGFGAVVFGAVGFGEVGFGAVVFGAVVFVIRGIFGSQSYGNMELKEKIR